MHSAKFRGDRVKPLHRYDDFRFFKMAVATILDKTAATASLDF